MYAIERTRLIKMHLEEHGQAQVQTLSSLLGVSEVTVRRDLERLEAEGWLTRTHGGAVINRPDSDTSLNQILSKSTASETHDEIVAIAMRMIADGDVIMLTNGEVNRCIASRLNERSNLTILTNDVACAALLTGQQQNKVVLLGGTLDQEEFAVFGSMTISNLNKFFVNRLFIEVDGISSDMHMSVSSQEKADFILEARAMAGNSIIVCPSDRFSHNAFFRLGDIRMAQGLVSDPDLEDSFKSQIFSSGVPMYTSMEAFEGCE